MKSEWKACSCKEHNENVFFFSSTNVSYYIQLKLVLKKPVELVIPPRYVHFPIHRKQTTT
jgi:hypothetical protein